MTTDMARAVAFYRSLGLQFPDNADGERHVEAELPGGMRLMFDTVEVIQSFSEWSPPSGGHRMALAFRCSDAAEVDATYARVVAEGHEGLKEPWDAFWGQRYAQLRDPDGNPVDLYADLG